MKTHADELDEMIDVVIKLVWTYTIFQRLFRKQDADSETRRAHPEFFLTMHDCLLCSFCVAVEILFKEMEKATSLWSLIRKSKPQLLNDLTRRILTHNSSIKKIEATRHQVCAHRWQAKSPQEVFAEAQLRFNIMTEITILARSLILELAREVDTRKKSELEKQQLSELTLNCVADDANKVLQGLRFG
jgi:hypothetical protein